MKLRPARKEDWIDIHRCCCGFETEVLAAFKKHVRDNGMHVGTSYDHRAIKKDRIGILTTNHGVMIVEEHGATV